MENYTESFTVPSEIEDALAQDFGYRDAADLHAQALAARASMPPEMRAAADEVDRDIERRLFFGG